MSNDDTVVIQGCDECNGRGKIRVWTMNSLPGIPTLPRKCPKCLGEGLVMNLHGGEQVPIQRP